MDPVSAAWRATGSPPAPGTPRTGVCARCLAHDQLTLTSRVVSDNFTGYDGWLNPQGHGLCPPCAWAYTFTSLRAKPHLILRDPPTLTPLDPAGLNQALHEPPTLDASIAVPSRAGRKHVLPAARWGRIQFDDTAITWTAADVARLAILTSFRERGISAAALGQNTPSWQVVRAVPESDRAEFLGQWNELHPWRASRPWLQLALLATPPLTRSRKP